MSPLQILTALVVVWVVWRFVRRFVTTSSLDNIPGPKPQSWWRGNALLIHRWQIWHGLLTNVPLPPIGSLYQFFDRHGWEFQDELGENYEPVVKLNGLFGVCYCPRCSQNPRLWMTFFFRVKLCLYLTRRPYKTSSSKTNISTSLQNG